MRLEFHEYLEGTYSKKDVRRMQIDGRDKLWIWSEHVGAVLRGGRDYTSINVQGHWIWVTESVKEVLEKLGE